MKWILPALMAPVLMVTGCTHFARIEQTRMGMTVEDLLRIDTPCYYGSQSDDKICYNCQFSVPTGRYGEHRSIKPYILTFEDGNLTDITINEKELDRQAARDRFYFEHRLYYPYGYSFYYGYPYWYP